MVKSNLIERTCEIILFLFFSIFFVNLVIDDGINWILNWTLLILFLILIYSYKKFFLPIPIALTLLAVHIILMLMKMMTKYKPLWQTVP